MKTNKHLHTTKVMRQFLRRVASLPEVKKVILGHGHICRRPCAKGTIEVVEVLPHGVSCRVYDDMGRREMFVSTGAAADMARMLRRLS